MGNWYFAKAKNIGINGFNNIGGSFLDSPIKSLSKEICQNSLDTKMSEYYDASWPKTIKVEFDEFWIEKEQLDGYKELYKVISDEYEFAQKYYQNDDTVTNFYKHALECLEKDKLKCLRISDYYTPGLTGSDKTNSAWANLVKNIGVSDKPNGSGGSKGQGKLAAYACSSLYTVFYNTNAVDHHRASAGVARLSGYELEDGYQTIGAGFYEDNGRPLKTGLKLLKDFKREEKEYGTDVIIVSFKDSFDGWKEQIIASTIDNFFVSLINEDLEIHINHGQYILNANTVDQYIKDKKVNKYLNGLTKKYYEVLTADHEKIITEYYTLFEENDLELKIKTDDEEDGLSNTVATIRLTGMKILDLDYLPRLGAYHGVLFLKGKKVNEYFRRLENDAHDKWSPDRADNVLEAKNKIEELKKFVRNTIKEYLAPKLSKEMDAEGVGEILPDEDLIDEDSKKTTETVENEKTVRVLITEKALNIKKNNLSKQKDQEEEDNDIELDENGKIISKRGPAENDIKKQKKIENPFFERYKEVSRRLIAKKLKVIGRENDYELVFSVNNEEPVLKMQIFIYGESNNEKPSIHTLKISKKGFFKSNVKFEYQDNEIVLLNVHPKEEYLLEFALDTDDIWPLEVRVYGNKEC